MAAAPAEECAIIEAAGVPLEITTAGNGRDILFLHSGSWLADEAAFVKELATLGRVVAPVHPGFGNSAAPKQLTHVDDLAYLYLDVIDTLDLEDILLVGASFGAWIAAEMAIKTRGEPAAMVLLDPLGVKLGTREERAIVDVFATPDRELEAMLYAQPERFHRPVAELDDIRLMRSIRSREALARYGWMPYMHDPKLPSRLHRVRAPTLVLWGDRDGIVKRGCCATYAEKLPRGRFETVANAGHLPHLEQTENVLAKISSFLADIDRGATSAQLEAR